MKIQEHKIQRNKVIHVYINEEEENDTNKFNNRIFYK